MHKADAKTHLQSTLKRRFILFLCDFTPKSWGEIAYTSLSLYIIVGAFIATHLVHHPHNSWNTLAEDLLTLWFLPVMSGNPLLHHIILCWQKNYKKDICMHYFQQDKYICVVTSIKKYTDINLTVFNRYHSKGPSTCYYNYFNLCESHHAFNYDIIHSIMMLFYTVWDTNLTSLY